MVITLESGRRLCGITWQSKSWQIKVAFQDHWSGEQDFRVQSVITKVGMGTPGLVLPESYSIPLTKGLHLKKQRVAKTSTQTPSTEPLPATTKAATQTSDSMPKRDKRNVSKDSPTPIPTNESEEGLSEIVQNAVSSVGQLVENFLTKLGSIFSGSDGNEPEVKKKLAKKLREYSYKKVLQNENSINRYSTRGNRMG